MNELKTKKMLTQLNQKAKNDIEQLKRDHEDDLKKV